jgi:hypothetical protein
MKTCQAGIYASENLRCTAEAKWSHDGEWCDDHRPAKSSGFGALLGTRIDATADYADGVREGLRLAAERACSDLAGLGGTVRKNILALGHECVRDNQELCHICGREMS